MSLRNVIDRPTSHRYAIGGAWFFIVVSLLLLGWAAMTLLAGGPGADATFYQAVEDGRTVNAIGLSYVGAAGLVLVMLQAAVVVAAAAASTLRRDTWRRIGHGVLIGWALLWALNLLWLTSIDQTLLSYGQSLTMLALLGCTVYRAAIGWSAPARQMRGAAALPADEFEAETLSSVDISHSDAVRELDRVDVEPDSRERRMQRGLARPGRLPSRWVGATAERAWPVVRRVGVVIGRWLQAMSRGIVRFLRSHGVAPQRSQPAARVE